MRFPTLTSTAPTVVADLQTQVDDYWDRGLLGFTLDPNFPSTPDVYVLYTYDAPIGGTAPVWNDACPKPPGATTDGCVVSGRLSRLTISDTGSTETPLINDWCQQFPSHSMGDLRFGADGALYASGGDGANFNNVDYGQFGGTSGSPTPANPCADPPTGSGGTQTAPTAEGGALRSQSVRRPSTEPILLNGSIIRVDPATGNASQGNPMAGNPDPNGARIVAYGLRNPFRFAIRPGTNELWVGNVGWNRWEAIDRVTDPLAAQVSNFGWPCYEGPEIQSSYQAANLNLCQSLYASPTGVVAPYYAYAHDSLVVPGETCPIGSSSITGLTFYAGGSYPAAYDGALFFADHSRNCIWAMLPGSNGLPDPTNIQTFVAGASNPVELEIGPGGDLFYVDHEGGAIHRITVQSRSAPTAVINAAPTSGTVPFTVNFDGTGSTDPNQGGTLSYAWDLNGDGTYDDSTSPTPSYTYTAPGAVTVGLRVTDSLSGLVDTTTIKVTAGSTPPSPTIDSPANSLTWAVGDTLSFSGHATDSLGNAISASGLDWALIIHHCPSNCHTHLVQTFPSMAGGSVAAPDHEYPSYLELQLTATDSMGSQATTSVLLYPKTVQLSMGSSPTGLSLSVGTKPATATPFTATEIEGSAITLSAPEFGTLGGTSYTYQSWSDGGVQSHTITASSDASFDATYGPALDTTPPTGSFSLAGGAASTPTGVIGVTDTATDTDTGVATMRVSNDGAIWDTVPYATSFSWDVTNAAFGGTGATGTKTVTMEWQDGAGNWSSPVQHSITLLTGATYHPLAPTRLLDTRSGNGLSGAFQANHARIFQVTGRGGVPANAVAVTGNLTVTGQTGAGLLFIGPNATNTPTSSTLNFPLGDNRANGVTVALSGTGRLSVTYQAPAGKTAQVIFDVTGYFVPDASGATYHPLAPTRLLDTRSGNGLSGAFQANHARIFQVTGRGGVPANAVAVTGNLTVTGQTGAGLLFIGPNATNTPTSSTLNFPLGDNRANGVTVALSGTGRLSVTYQAPAGKTAQVIFDVTGYFAP
jgi:glucose/arabinose dehydrogenase